MDEPHLEIPTDDGTVVVNMFDYGRYNLKDVSFFVVSTEVIPADSPPYMKDEVRFDREEDEMYDEAHDVILDRYILRWDDEGSSPEVKRFLGLGDLSPT